jgi:hypothetical protein
MSNNCCEECKFYKRNWAKDGECSKLKEILDFEYTEYRYNSTTPVTTISVPFDFCCNKFEGNVNHEEKIS